MLFWGYTLTSLLLWCSVYTTVVYLLIESDSGCLTRFVPSKTRVFPVKELTIPRLELLSALLLSKLMTSEALSLELSLDEPQGNQGP